MPQLGAGLGTIIGILEEFGNSMSIMNRIGAGVGQNFITLRNDAAEVGLSLGDLSKLSKESGVTVGALGKNTKEGVNRLLGFTKALRESTEAAGYYGMGAAELAQYMTDELEVRRQLGDANALRTMNETALASAINENLAAQQAMASLTGQDVRDRLKAQQEYKKDARSRALLLSLNEKQAAAMNTVQGAMNQFGEAAPMIQRALNRKMLGLEADAETQRFYQAAQLAGVDMRSVVAGLATSVEGGRGEEGQALITATAGQAKDARFDESLQRLAQLPGPFGEAVAAFMTMGSTAISTGATTTDEAAKQQAEARATLDASIADGSAAFLGLTNNLETATNNIKVASSNAMLAAANIDISNLNTAQQKFNDLAISMSALPDNPFFHSMLTMLSTAAIVGTGARGILNINGYGGGGSPSERAENALMSANDMAMMGLQAGTAAGVDPNNPAMIAAQQLKTAIILGAGATDLLMSNQTIADRVRDLQQNVDDSSTQLGKFAIAVEQATRYITNTLHITMPN